MSLHAITRELDALMADLHHLETRAHGDDAPPATWYGAALTAQIDALHLRIDAIAAEVHAYQAMPRATAAPALDAAG